MSDDILPSDEIDTKEHSIQQGDATDLPFEDEEFHAIVTDPPYFLGAESNIDTQKLLEKSEKKSSSGFMSMDWDGGEVEVVEKDGVPEELL